MQAPLNGSGGSSLQGPSEVYRGNTNVVYHQQQGYAKNGSYEEQHGNGKQESHFIRNGGGNQQNNGTAGSLTNGHKTVMDYNGRKDLSNLLSTSNIYFSYISFNIYVNMGS